MKYWLLKTEPESFSIEDLQNAPNQTTFWDGVRNYQARNYLRDEIKPGDRVLFYHSNANPPAIVGTAKVTKAGYPDHTAWDETNHHYDPGSTPEKPSRLRTSSASRIIGTQSLASSHSPGPTFHRWNPRT